MGNDERPVRAGDCLRLLRVSCRFSNHTSPRSTSTPKVFFSEFSSIVIAFTEDKRPEFTKELEFAEEAGNHQVPFHVYLG